MHTWRYLIKLKIFLANKKKSKKLNFGFKYLFAIQIALLTFLIKKIQNKGTLLWANLHCANKCQIELSDLTFSLYDIVLNIVQLQ